MKKVYKAEINIQNAVHKTIRIGTFVTEDEAKHRVVELGTLIEKMFTNTGRAFYTGIPYATGRHPYGRNIFEIENRDPTIDEKWVLDNIGDPCRLDYSELCRRLSMAYRMKDKPEEYITSIEQSDYLDEVTHMSKEYREYILDEAKKIVCKDRNKQYGNPENNFETIGKLWHSYLKGRWPDGWVQDIDGRDVAMMMALLKIARIATAEETKLDSFIDLAGYAACGAGCVTGDLVPNETEQYLEKSDRKGYYKWGPFELGLNKTVSKEDPNGKEKESDR